MVLNTIVYIALVILMIIVVIVLLRFLFGVLFIAPVGYEMIGSYNPIVNNVLSP